MLKSFARASSRRFVTWFMERQRRARLAEDSTTARALADSTLIKADSTLYKADAN